MQVVYSGGTSNNLPSPRFHRKKFSDPVLPGYTSQYSYPHCLPPHRPHHTHHKSNSTHHDDDVSLRDSIPAMRKGIAIACLLCNVVLPGFGTFLSGITVYCGSRVRKPPQTKFSVVRVNCLVAIIQFFTTFLFLLGWIWSLMWGVAFVVHSAEFPKDTTNTPTADDVNKHNVLEKVSTSEPNLTDSTCKENIITLKEPPLTTVPLNEQERLKPVLRCVNTRQQRILRRQMSESEMNAAMLTIDGIEEIITGDYPVHVRNGEAVTTTEDEVAATKW